MIPASVARLAFCALSVLGPAGRIAAQTGMPPRSIMLIDFERQKKNVLAYIDVMPDSAITFAPTPGVRNFAQQIEHFVGTNTEIAAIVLKDLKAPPTLGDTAAYRHSSRRRTPSTISQRLPAGGGWTCPRSMRCGRLAS